MALRIVASSLVRDADRSFAAEPQFRTVALLPGQSHLENLVDVGDGRTRQERLGFNISI